MSNREVLKRAWADTKAFPGLNAGTLITFVLVLVSSFFLWWSRGGVTDARAVIDGVFGLGMFFLAGILIFVFYLWNAPLSLMEEALQERDRLKANLDNLLSPHVEITHREADNRYRITENDSTRIALISIHNNTASTIHDIRVSCIDALAWPPSTLNLGLRTGITFEPISLSPGESRYVRVIAFIDEPASKRLEVLVPYGLPQPEVLAGEEFLIKLVVVGEHIPAARMKLRVGP